MKSDINDHKTKPNYPIHVEITRRSGEVNYAYTYDCLLRMFDITDLAVTMNGRHFWASELNAEDFANEITAKYSGAIIRPSQNTKPRWFHLEVEGKTAGDWDHCGEDNPMSLDADEYETIADECKALAAELKEIWADDIADDEGEPRNFRYCETIVGDDGEWHNGEWHEFAV